MLETDLKEEVVWQENQENQRFGGKWSLKEKTEFLSNWALTLAILVFELLTIIVLWQINLMKKN